MLPISTLLRTSPSTRLLPRTLRRAPLLTPPRLANLRVTGTHIERIPAALLLRRVLLRLGARLAGVERRARARGSVVGTRLGVLVGSWIDRVLVLAVFACVEGRGACAEVARGEGRGVGGGGCRAVGESAMEEVAGGLAAEHGCGVQRLADY